MTTDDWQQWFEAAWTQREESVYGALFGHLGPGIYPLDFDLFRSAFGRMQIDPRWMHIGVFESPPNDHRPNWVYVSSGLSNAWEAKTPDPESWSGLGIELLMQCSEQSPWALALLRKLTAYQLLLSVGEFGGKPLDAWDRMKPGAPIDGRSSELQALLFIPSPEFGGVQQLLSGRFEFLQVVGTTIPELEHGRTHGFEALLDELTHAGAAPVVNVHRRSLI